MRFALVTVLALAPALAHADPAISFDVEDHGQSVEVIAHNVQAKNLNFSSVRSRIEIQVNGASVGAMRMMSADPTVFLVEFDGSVNRVLSIKTRLDRPEVKTLAGLAKATQVGTDLHIAIPRHTLAEVTPPAIVVAPKLEPKLEPKPEPKLEEKPTLTKIEAPVAKLEPKIAPKIEPKIEPALPAKPESHPIPPEAKDGFSTSPGVYGVGALVTLLACGYMMKKKKQDAAVTSTIDVVAQRALGNKAKVMWLSAGGREMLVSVTQQNVQMLGSWPKTDREGAEKDLPRATQLERALTNITNATPTNQTFQQQLAAEVEAPALQPQSNAVAGILKLRARAGTVQPTLPPIHPDIATDDEDADLEWAKEMLTATGGRR